MKRILIIFSFTAFSISLRAQDSLSSQNLISKRGEAYLPEAKDWGIGVDATPVFNYFNNIGKSYTNNIPTITGKYFKDAHTAYRVAAHFGITSTTTRSKVRDRGIAPGGQQIFAQPAPTKENTWKRSGTAIGLSAGIEKRRGKTRLQGFYGVEAGIYISSSKDKFSYGNALSITGTAVDVSNDDAFNNANNVDTSVSIQAKIGYARVTQRKNGTNFTLGIRAFVGAEYFVLPKLSIGAEFGWGLGVTAYGRTITEYESKGTSTTGDAMIAPTTVEGSKRGAFKLDTNSLNALWGNPAVIKVCLYF